MNSFFLQVFYAIFSGLMEAAAISNKLLPFGSPFLGLFCLIPMYGIFYKAKNYRQAFFFFLVQSLTVHLLSSYWLANFRGFAIFTLGASAFGTALEGGLCGAVSHFLPAQLNKKNLLEEDGGRHPHYVWIRIIWFSASWVMWEWMKSTGFLAYPWGTLSMAAYRWKLITQIADITGVWGVTFLFALFSALIAEGYGIMERIPRAQNNIVMAESFVSSAKTAGIFFAICLVYGIFQYVVPRTPVKTLNTVLVQQNVDPWESGDAASIAVSKKLTEQQVNLMRDIGMEPDLVLWSEGVLGYTYPSAIQFYREFPQDESLTAFIARMDIPFVIGGRTLVDHNRQLFSNSAIFFDRNGDYAGFYSKKHLVPFAERIPWAENPLMKFFMGKVVGFTSTLTPGNQYVLFKIPKSKQGNTKAALWSNLPPETTIALEPDGTINKDTASRYTENPGYNPDSYISFTTPICFEDAFSDVCSQLYRIGSEVFLNITNDSWSKEPPAEYQHFIAASYRAIEYRTTLVRCTNSGYSAIVDPSGRVIMDLPVFTETALGFKVPVYERKKTVYSMMGDWFAYLLFAFMGSVFVWSTVFFYIIEPKKTVPAPEKEKADDEREDAAGRSSENDTPPGPSTEQSSAPWEDSPEETSDVEDNVFTAKGNMKSGHVHTARPKTIAVPSGKNSTGTKKRR